MPDTRSDLKTSDKNGSPNSEEAYPSYGGFHVSRGWDTYDFPLHDSRMEEWEQEEDNQIPVDNEGWRKK